MKVDFVDVHPSVTCLLKIPFPLDAEVRAFLNSWLRGLENAATIMRHQGAARGGHLILSCTLPILPSCVGNQVLTQCQVQQSSHIKDKLITSSLYTYIVFNSIQSAFNSSFNMHTNGRRKVFDNLQSASVSMASRESVTMKVSSPIPIPQIRKLTPRQVKTQGSSEMGKTKG